MSPHKRLTRRNYRVGTQTRTYTPSWVIKTQVHHAWPDSNTGPPTGRPDELTTWTNDHFRNHVRAIDDRSLNFFRCCISFAVDIMLVAFQEIPRVPNEGNFLPPRWLLFRGYMVTVDEIHSTCEINILNGDYLINLKTIELVGAFQ
ncbi:hypothetical protein LXL04_004649 [Taraxacum kok-saghyz]